MSVTEEEIFVYAELDESLNTDNFRTVHVLGTENDNPIIQMDDNFFVGKYEHPMGTYMFFEHDPSAKSMDILFDKLAEKNLKYVCKSRKLLKMERTYVTPKEGTEKELLSKLQQPEEEIDAIKFNSIQEAIEKFKNDWNGSAPEIKIESIAAELAEEDVALDCNDNI